MHDLAIFLFVIYSDLVLDSCSFAFLLLFSFFVLFHIGDVTGYYVTDSPYVHAGLL